jgi:hypothetical protein
MRRLYRPVLIATLVLAGCADPAAVRPDPVSRSCDVERGLMVVSDVLGHDGDACFAWIDGLHGRAARVVFGSGSVWSRRTQHGTGLLTTAAHVLTPCDGEGDCPDGPRELGGVSVVTFLCGSATATVTTSDGDWSLVGGTCEAREDTFAVNFGTVVLDVAAALDGTAPEVDYVGVAVHEGAGGDGSYDDVDMVTVVATIAGEEFGAGTGTVSLRDGRTAGEAATEGVTIAFECG